MVKHKSKLGKFYGYGVQKQKITLTINYIPFENLLTKKRHDIYILLKFSFAVQELRSVSKNCAFHAGQVQVTENY